MKSVFTFLVLAVPFLVNSQMLATIDDPNGYTDIRKGPDSRHEIVGQIEENEIFLIDELKDDWAKVYKIEDGYLEGYIHQSQITPLNKLQKIGRSKFTEGEVDIDDSNILFSLRYGSFIKSQHKYELQADKYVVKIDGLEPYGVDGSYPSTQIIELNLLVEGVTIHIPSRAYSDLYNISYNNIEIRKGLSGVLFVVMANNSDGAGGYDVVWIFKDKMYLNRFVSRI